MSGDGVLKIRSVRPEFFTDVKMARLSFGARLLYIGLWSYADDEGRGEYLPKLIEGAIFPHESADFATWWAELEGMGRVVRYEVEGQSYFMIPTFGDHQKPNRVYASKLPPPPPLPAPTQLAQRVDTAYAPPVEVEGEGEGEVVVAPRARNEVWDTLAELFGEPTTRTNQSLRGKLVKSLSEAGATGDTVRTRVQAWPFHFPDATLTETALEKHWDRLGRPPARMSEADVAAYQQQVQQQQRLRRAALIDAEQKGLPG